MNDEFVVDTATSGGEMNRIAILEGYSEGPFGRLKRRRGRGKKRRGSCNKWCRVLRKCGKKFRVGTKAFGRCARKGMGHAGKRRK